MTAAGVRVTRARRSRRAPDPGDSLLVHDIKNLSFRLCALLHNLEANYEDPEFKHSVVDILSDTVRQMDGIVRCFRERKDGVIVKVPVDLNECVAAVAAGLPRSFLERSGVLLEERYGRLPKIWGDPEFLREAFVVLIQNAVEAMTAGGGRLSIATEAARGGTAGRRAIVRIADTGCGMDPGFVRDHLFVPFVTTKEGGLGMGLYAVKRILGMHGGTIRVASRVGRGTTFTIIFPVA